MGPKFLNSVTLNTANIDESHAVLFRRLKTCRGNGHNNARAEVVERGTPRIMYLANSHFSKSTIRHSSVQKLPRLSTGVVVIWVSLLPVDDTTKRAAAMLPKSISFTST